MALLVVKMRMSDVPVGETVFLMERIGDEIRETYYTRRVTGVYHHGCAQGVEPPLTSDACPWESGRPTYRPRYLRFDPLGTFYPMTSALPVQPLENSRFWKYTWMKEDTR